MLVRVNSSCVGGMNRLKTYFVKYVVHGFDFFDGIFSIDVNNTSGCD